MTPDSRDAARRRTPLPSLSVPRSPSLAFAARVPPDWARIEQLREGVVLAVEAAYAPVLVGDQTGIVVSELVENAIKYGTTEPIEVRIDGDQRSIRIAVTNRLTQGVEQAEQLAAHVAWIESFDDPQEAYMACLTIAFQRTGTRPSGSGLGLARIRYEGGCSLSLESTSAGELTVVARQAIDWMSQPGEE